MNKQMRERENPHTARDVRPDAADDAREADQQGARAWS